MSAAQVPEWVRIFEAIIIGLGLGTFLWGGGRSDRLCYLPDRQGGKGAFPAERENGACG